jgi:hypothetical protein
VHNFDAYLMVDWSAREHPATGADSIWYCLLTRRHGDPVVDHLANPPTRRRATAEIKQILIDLVRQNRSVLVGFDFPYGYPAGFAGALNLVGPPKWLAVWREVARRIQDGPDNTNNRFAVAAQFNRLISGRAYPFWGCPAGMAGEFLSCNKPEGLNIAEKRITDIGAMQPVWKLFYPGCVGSQTLLGIPYLLELRIDAVLAPVSRVWPFEIELDALPNPSQRDYLVLHAEIYPSLIQVTPTGGEAKDRAQVRELAAYFAELDSAGRLLELFAGNRSLTAAEREFVESEEGWTLGVCATPNGRERDSATSPASTRTLAGFRQSAPSAVAEPEAAGGNANPIAEESESRTPFEWVYFAAPSVGAGAVALRDLVKKAGMIFCHIYFDKDDVYQRLPHVKDLHQGHRLLLVYGAGSEYSVVLGCVIQSTDRSVRNQQNGQQFDVFSYVDDQSVCELLEKQSYTPDPKLGRFTGISVEVLPDPPDIPGRISRPRPGDRRTIWGWDEVFPKPRS